MFPARKQFEYIGPSTGGSKAVVVRRCIKRVVVGLKAASHVPVTAQEAIERRAKQVDFDAPNHVGIRSSSSHTSSQSRSFTGSSRSAPT